MKIGKLIRVPELESLYSTQLLSDLVLDIFENGQRVPICINTKFEIIDGYRRVDAITEIGWETVEALIVDCQAIIDERVRQNQYRIKTTQDKIEELKTIFTRYPKKQGQKTVNGKTYDRNELIADATQHRYASPNTVAKLEFIVEHDLKDNFLSKAIIENTSKVDSAYQFLKNNLELDKENRYGFTEKIMKGEISVADANELIQQKHNLDLEFAYSFVIPKKIHSYNIECTEISKLTEFKGSVDLILTSPPYWNLRNYEGGAEAQLGQERTKEEYCFNVAEVFSRICSTLKETANVIINVGESYADGVGQGILFLLKEAIEKYTSLKYKETLIWSKSNPKPQSENILRPVNCVEFLLWFVVDPQKAKYRMLTYPVEGKKAEISKGVKDVDSKGKIGIKSIGLSKPYGKIWNHIKEQDVANIIHTSVGKNHEVYKIYEGGHPAIMSPLLPVVPILMTTKEGDLVYDPFSGSNVIGRMSQLLNRRTLSTEVSKDYFNIGCRMLKESVQEFNRSDLDVINNRVYQNGDTGDQYLSIAA
jgi:DNA modification methylase